MERLRGAYAVPRLLIVVLIWPGPCTHSQLDETVRVGSCGLHVPIGFTCADLPEYNTFLKHLQRNAQAGFPIDDALYQEAFGIISRWQSKTYTDHPPEGFFKYLCGDQGWPLPDKMCLYGFVSAMLVRARHMMVTGDEKLLFQAKLDLEYGTTVLGNELCLDFLDASPWPVSSLDLYLNMNQTEFTTNYMYTKQHPIRSPAVSFDQIQWKTTTAPAKKLGGPTLWEIPAIILGSHATLSMEPVEMIRRSVADCKLTPIFVGIEARWCQILGACNQGAPALAKLVKASEADPFAFPWTVMMEQLRGIYDSDMQLQGAELLICTEPMAVCLMLRQVAGFHGRLLPVLGYMGVALLNGCPPEDVNTFWDHFRQLLHEDTSASSRTPAALAVNNMILSEQIFYQTGIRMPYVRAHGLYTQASYKPLHDTQILMWRAPLFAFATLKCAMGRFQISPVAFGVSFKFLDDSEHISWTEAAHYRAVVLLPWDHALMTFYELYSANVPLLLPSKEWMYRLIYQRGQLSVGERWYQSTMPGHEPPFAEFEEVAHLDEDHKAPDTAWGMTAAKTARGAAEHMLLRALSAPDLDHTKEMISGALSLVKDMSYFLAVAGNRTDTDSSTSMGVVRGVRPLEAKTLPKAPRSKDRVSNSYHPYTPFQMSNRDSNDWTRKRMGGWWLRRGVRYEAMRYWYQFSDFARFPGIRYFDNLVELICMSRSLDTQGMSTAMKQYNELSLAHSASFWSHAMVELLSAGRS